MINFRLRELSGLKIRDVELLDGYELKVKS